MNANVHDFSVDDHVVYPAHGVGQVVGVETQEVAGMAFEVYIITDASGALLTISATNCLKSLTLVASPWRANRSGATA